MKNKNLDTIKEEVYKCSKCGLCQSVCPVYLATKNEMYLPRGRYIVLNNFFNNGKKLSYKFIKNLDICLNCNACKNFCPSNIDSKNIFTNIKYNYDFRYSFIEFSYIYFFEMFKHRIKRFFFPKSKEYKYEIKRQVNKVQPDLKEKVFYFQGCTNKYINPSDKNASLNLLEEMGYQVIKISKHCCGLPFLSDGNFNKFNKNANEIQKSIPDDVKYIVCSCDSCYETLKNAFKDNEISKKLITLDELLNLNFKNIPIVENTVLHKTNEKDDICSIFSNIPIINRKGSCSLMENFFLMKYPKYTQILLKEVFYKKDEIDNKIIITTSQITKTGLKYGIEEIKSNATVYTYAEYINKFS